MPGICLNMIVKNEASILERCLASVAPWISHYVVADTGSTDGTQDLVQTFFAKHGIPGQIVDVPFRDFEQARNDALVACRTSSADFDYILLTDADMELVCDGADFRPQLQAPAHLVRQNSGLIYDNVRFVQRSLPARYIGVTHEYLDTCGHAGKPRLDGVWFRDHATGSNRKVKFERDLRLLRAGLKREPHNARYMFYLAQTFKDLDRYKEAIAWYERRIQAGGYAEEIWYATYMIAACLQKLGRYDAFVRRAFEAYELRPTRAEPLLLLSNHYRERRSYAVATLFSEAGDQIAFPHDDHLFVEQHAYDHGFRHDLSIVGRQSPHAAVRERAYEACMDLATDPNVPCVVRSTAIDNSQHYAVPLQLAFGPSARVLELDLPPLLDEPSYAVFNPSIASHNGKLFVNLRWSNYRIGTRPSGTWRRDIHSGLWIDAGGPDGIRTVNEFAELSITVDTATVGNRRRIRHPADHPDDAPRIPTALVQGYEDLRIFRLRGRWWASATVRDRHATARAEITVLELEEAHDTFAVSRAHVQRSYEAEKHQKNWVPLVHQDALRFVYESDPTIILRFDPETRSSILSTRTEPDSLLTTLRGSSQAIPFALHGEPGFLYVVHEAFARPTGRVYTHRILWLDARFRVQHASDPFYFTKPGVEFCAGLAEHEDSFVMSFGVDDERAFLAIVDRDELVGWLIEPERRRAQSDRQ
jgi:glycosyltransferase involved in cell wall biosynthesis